MLQHFKDEEQYFNDFIIEPQNLLVYNIAKKLIEDSIPSDIPIVFYGPKNSGKSQLISVIISNIKKFRPDSKIIHLEAKKFYFHYIKSLQQRNYQYFRKLYRNCDYFFLEDLHVLKNKNKTQQELTFIINELQRKNSKVVVSSRLNLKKTLIPALISRLANGLMLKMEAISDKAVIEYCQKTANVYKVSANIKLLEDLWQAFDGSFGAFKKFYINVLAVLSQKKMPMTYSLIEELTKLKDNSKEAKLDKILLKVSNQYHITSIDMLKSKSKTRYLTEPRCIAIALAKKLLNFESKQLQDIFGGRSESSIRYCLKKVQNDKNLQDKYQSFYKSMSYLKKA